MRFPFSLLSIMLLIPEIKKTRYIGYFAVGIAVKSKKKRT